MSIVSRIIRAPFLMISLIAGAVLTVFILASISVGDWCEDVLHQIGYRGTPYWLPLALGIAGYLGLGIAAPALAGYQLTGWLGAILGPVVVLIAIVLLGRW